MKKISCWLLLFIIAIAFFLRIWHVGSLPVILNRDEAAVAYNASLLMQTGQDEWGKTWPLTLQSFGDYKLPGYSVLLIPFFKIFGLDDWVVRLPSVLAGTVLVGLVYLLARKLKFDEQSALLASLLIAIAPVFVFYSRIAFEANVALTYFVGALFVLISLKERATLLRYALMTALLLLAVLTYNTPLLLLPFVMVFAAILFPKKSRKNLLVVEGILGVVLVAGALVFLPAAAQKSGITIFTDETVWSQWTAFRTSLPGVWQTLLGSKYVYFAWLMGKNFVNSFSLRFLVTQGGSHPWHSLPSTGHLEFLVYIFGLIGIALTSWQVWLSRRTFSAVTQPLALLFLLVASLAPSVITVDSPHATRSLLFFVLFHIFAVIGVGWFVTRFSTGKARVAWKLIIVGVIAEGMLHAYQLFVIYPSQQVIFQPGFDTVVQKVEQMHPSDKVAIVDAAGYQYILLAWYLKVPPAQYFSTVIRQLPDRIGFRYGQQVTHYHFIAKPEDRVRDESVLIQWSDQTGAWQVKEDL